MNNTQYKKIMLRLLLPLLCGVCFGTTAFSATKNQKTEEQSLDRVVAVVNESIITQSELDEAVDRIKKQFAGSNSPLPPQDALQKRLLSQLIERKLQLLLAEQAGVQIKDSEIDKTIAGIANQNKLTPKELYSKVTGEGMSTETYRKEIHDELTIQQIQQHEVGSHISITPEEVDDMMRSAVWQAYSSKEYHLEDILITLPSTPSPQDVAAAKKKAQNVLTKIHKGMSFHDVAMAESGNSNALQGGDLGWLKLPQIPAEFADQLVHMKQSEILGPVPTPNGFHIIRLAGIRTFEKQGDAAAQHKQVEQLLYQRKFEEGLQSWITKLRSEAFVNMNPEG